MKKTTSAKALDFTRHTHPGHKGRGFHPKTQKSGQVQCIPCFRQSRGPPKKSTAEVNYFYFNSSSRPARKRRSGSAAPGQALSSYEARTSGIRPNLRHRSARRKLMRIFASFSKIFTAQYAENSGAVRGVLGVEASAGHPSRPKAGLPGTPDYGRGKQRFLFRFCALALVVAGQDFRDGLRMRKGSPPGTATGQRARDYQKCNRDASHNPPHRGCDGS
jgi:hypothetical protein